MNGKFGLKNLRKYSSRVLHTLRHLAQVMRAIAKRHRVRLRPRIQVAEEAFKGYFDTISLKKSLDF
jgi:hypothetical protein